MTVTIDPRRHDAVIFDLDGVITDTASVHAAAWKHLFDTYLAARAEGGGEEFRPFTDEDYRRYVDGRPRYDGVAAFLESRGVSLPWGDPGDDEDAETVCGLGNRKNRQFVQQLDDDGVAVFESTVALVRRLQETGIATGVFSSSRNCEEVLEAASLGDLFPVRVDGVVADDLGLPGKPDPAVLVEATRRLGATPARTVVVEDAESGVEAGRRGGFRLVIGIDRHGQPGPLRDGGADVVVSDLAEVVVAGGGRPLSEVPDAVAAWGEVAAVLRHRRPVVFLDFDGTLSEIVDIPSEATLVDGAAAALARLTQACPVAVISGRDLLDVRGRVGIDGLWYAGSHGFELWGPDGERHDNEEAGASLPALQEAAAELRARLGDVVGVIVEEKGFALAVHYRTVAPERADGVLAAVNDAGRRHPDLAVSHGRKVAELRPAIDWHKGRALRWVLERILDDPAALPVYVGDDLTDEDALAEVASDGLGIVVRSDEHGDRPTEAHVAVDGPRELCQLLGLLADLLAAGPPSGSGGGDAE